MNKKLLKTLSVFVVLASLTSCGNNSTSSVISSQTSSSSSSSSSEIKADLTEKDLAKGKTTYTTKDGQTANLNQDTLYRNQNSPHLNPVASGGQHVFVAPFTFQAGTSDYDKKTTAATEEVREKIVTTFTASDEVMSAKTDNTAYSVQSFYTKSSYGKAKFECDVMPWITYNGTASQFNTACSGNAGVYAAQYCRTWYLNEYAKDNHGALGENAKPFTYYDADGDGFMDLIWIVYTYPEDYNSNWWAYVTYDTSTKADVDTPTVKTLGWASTSFMSKGCNGYDSHTFIHETGHTFGLDDYYDYNNKWKPMGSVDFMDQNLGDHSAFSKFTLGWANPYILTEEQLKGGKTAVITLNAFTNSGDSLVLASPNYNGTAFDEYFILELVGPTGLAKNDYINGYQNTTGYTKPGVRILHVDARVYNSLSKDKYPHDTYVSDADKIGQEATEFRVDNSYGGRNNNANATDTFPYTDASGKKQTGYYSLVSLIQSNGSSTSNWMTSANYNATNSDLFSKGHKFNLSNAAFSQYMPSRSNLWNKAKTITGRTTAGKEIVEIDDSITCNYNMKVLSIDEDATYGYTCKLQITLD